jgi:hypothetical protein
MVDWKSKLTSRKFWTAVAGLVSGLIIFFKGSEATATQVTALIMAAASVVAYIIGEGMTDAANSTKTVEFIQAPEEAHPPAEYPDNDSK